MAFDVLRGQAEGSVYVLGKCVWSGKDYATAEFPRAALEAYENGQNIQDACHMLSAGDREFILSGISPAAWNAAFPPEEDDVG